MLRTTLLLLAAFFYTSPALAAWGENWGEMVWGAAPPAAVPMMDGLGLGLLALVLIGLAIRGLRSRATLGLMVLASFVGAADLAEAQVTIPNTFSDGTPALASEVNENFAALAAALESVCTAAGGTWNTGTSTCTAAASSYNCFIGGYCAQAAINFPPAEYGYTNIYDGDTQGTDPALAAGCNASGSSLWLAGAVSAPGPCAGPGCLLLIGTSARILLFSSCL
jgi:hypothetical protein